MGGCLGRKRPNWGENPEIWVFRSKMPQLGRIPRNWGVWVENAPIGAKIPKLGCLGRKCPNRDKNPEIGIFTSKMPQLGRKSRNWGVWVENAQLGQKSRNWGV